MPLAQLEKLLPTDRVGQHGADKWVQANRIRNTAFGSSNLIVEEEIKRYLGFSQPTNPKHLALITVQSSSTPYARNYPTVLAGGKDLGLRHGQHIKAREERPLGDLFVMMLQRLDFPVRKFADNAGEFSEIV